MSIETEERPRAYAFLGGIASMGVPVAVCPACWPAYMGLAGTMGLGFLTRGPAVLPFAAVLLIVALAPLALRAWVRRSPGPLALGLTGAMAVVVGRLVLGSDPVTLAGGGLLVLASVWNAWPRRSSACAACVVGTEAVHLN